MRGRRPRCRGQPPDEPVKVSLGERPGKLTCTDWEKGTEAERRGSVEQLTPVAEGNANPDDVGPNRVLPEDKAYEVFESGARDPARGFLLYEIYNRAARLRDRTDRTLGDRLGRPRRLGQRRGVDAVGGGISAIARSAIAVIVSVGLTPGLPARPSRRRRAGSRSRRRGCSGSTTPVSGAGADHGAAEDVGGGRDVERGTRSAPTARCRRSARRTSASTWSAAGMKVGFGRSGSCSVCSLTPRPKSWRFGAQAHRVVERLHDQQDHRAPRPAERPEQCAADLSGWRTSPAEPQQRPGQPGAVAGHQREEAGSSSRRPCRR